MLLALSSTSLRSSTPREVIEAAREMGYPAVELWAEHVWDAGEDPAALGRRAAERGLALSLHGPSRDLNVTSANPGIRRESRAQYARCLDEAAAMGARAVNLHPGALSSTHDDPETFLGHMATYCAEIAARAGELGLSVGIEIMEPRRGEYLTTLEGGKRLIERAGRPGLGLTLDIAHLLSGGRDADPRGYEDLIRHVHISGSTRERVHVPLAEGAYDLAPPLAALGRFYAGIVAVEGYAPGREMAAARENKETFDRLLAAAS